MLQRLVENLLTVSKIDAGAIVVDAEEFALSDAVRSVIDGLGDAASKVDLCAPPELVVRADPDHVHRIFTNYLTNALTYGAPPVAVKAAEAGEFIEVGVQDDGPGVPEDLAPRLFGKFARGEDSKSREGTGLGLSIVRGLAQANGGDAWYRPVRPRGSCFMVKLPRGERKSA
jgi:signal transduction histidine kinase